MLRRMEPIPEDWKRGVVIVAHPDDIEYATAAAVHRWVGEGATVTYHLLTRGEAGIDTMPPAEAARVREAEERESARRVGVDVAEGFAVGAGWLVAGGSGGATRGCWPDPKRKPTTVPGPGL